MYYLQCQLTYRLWWQRLRYAGDGDRGRFWVMKGRCHLSTNQCWQSLSPKIRGSKRYKWKIGKEKPWREREWKRRRESNKKEKKAGFESGFLFHMECKESRRVKTITRMGINRRHGVLESWRKVYNRKTTRGKKEDVSKNEVKEGPHHR